VSLGCGFGKSPTNKNYFLENWHADQGCQIYLGTTYQNGKNIPIDYKMYRMVKNIPFGCKTNKMALKIPTSSIARTFKIYPN
jgi:hypothetical protein